MILNLYVAYLCLKTGFHNLATIKANTKFISEQNNLDEWSEDSSISENRENAQLNLYLPALDLKYKM